MNSETYRRWFEYEKDSHEKALTSLNAVPVELRTSDAFRRAVDLMAHIVAARRMWLFRFGVTDQPIELFPRGVDLAELPRLLTEMQAEWASYLMVLEDTELTHELEYQSYEGERFRNSISDILTQLFGHSWYHRGQIALLLRQMGAEPAVTDFVYWAREPVVSSTL